MHNHKHLCLEIADIATFCCIFLSKNLPVKILWSRMYCTLIQRHMFIKLVWNKESYEEEERNGLIKKVLFFFCNPTLLQLIYHELLPV
jgi:hypothetical protein